MVTLGSLGLMIFLIVLVCLPRLESHWTLKCLQIPGWKGGADPRLKALLDSTVCVHGFATAKAEPGTISLAGMCLGELVINPHQQHMDAFYWVMDWEGMISVSSLVGLLEKHFFPKWLQVHCAVQGGRVGW